MAVRVEETGGSAWRPRYCCRSPAGCHGTAALLLPAGLMPQNSIVSTLMMNFGTMGVVTSELAEAAPHAARCVPCARLPLSDATASHPVCSPVGVDWLLLGVRPVHLDWRDW